MVGGFTGRGLVVVARGAIAGDAGMVEAGLFETVGALVAKTARLGGRDVVGGLAQRNDIVVARFARRRGLTVVHLDLGERRYNVAGLALTTCRHVRDRLARRALAVMAQHAAGASL